VAAALPFEAVDAGAVGLEEVEAFDLVPFIY